MSGVSADATAANQMMPLFQHAEALHAAGLLDDAERLYRTILVAVPAHVEALHQLGVVMYQLGRHDEALRLIDHALEIDPAHDRALNTRAVVLIALDRRDEALASYDRALSVVPHNAVVAANRGDLLAGLERHDEALISYELALATAAGSTQAKQGRAASLLALDRGQEALDAFDVLLIREPDSATAHLGRGKSLMLLDRQEEAATSFAAALRCQPDLSDAQLALAEAFCLLGRFQEAVSLCDQLVTRFPDNAELRFNRSLCRLALGDLAGGWRDYEWRWQLERVSSNVRDFGVPQWNGDTDISGKTILLHAEQGFGDVLQFCRYAPLVAAHANVVLEVPGPLVRLLTSLPARGQIIAQGETLPPFDLHCPLLSLPFAANTTLDTIPTTTRYLAADPQAVAAWRERLAALDGVHVGLCWAGSPRPNDPAANAIDRRRSVALAHYLPLAAVSGVSLISLQKYAEGARITAPPAGMVIHDWTGELQDFADTAALIEALDLVITVDTAVAHLAGALGKPVWILNRYDACWRWLVDRDDSPWYPTARLWRQPKPGDWDSVIARVAEALRDFVHAGPSRPITDR
jgi:tetratricopeptide (TPR) repeat protein